MIIVYIFWKLGLKFLWFFEFGISDKKRGQKQREGYPKQTKPLLICPNQIFASGKAGKNKSENERSNNRANLIDKFGYAKPETRTDLFGGVGGDGVAGWSANTLPILSKIIKTATICQTPVKEMNGMEIKSP